MKSISFNDQWVKSVSKDEFVKDGLVNTDWTAEDLTAYYNEIVPAAKPVAATPETPIQTLLKKEQELQDEINTLTDGTKRNAAAVSKPD